MSIFLLLLCVTMTLATGMRIELHHLDAKADITAADRFRRASARAQIRLESFGVAAPLTLGYGDYIAHFAIGNPPQEVRSMLDTMTNLVWIQCAQCRPSNCFDQDVGIYDYRLSSTGMAVYCNDTLCTNAYRDPSQPCTGYYGADACAIRTSFINSVDVAGVLRIELFTFGSAKANIAFGCITKTSMGQNNYLGGASGFIGLGRGAPSLVSQISGHRFSYCLNHDYRQPSSLFVGPSAALNDDEPFTYSVLAMPPRGEPLLSSSYFLGLTTMSVGETSFNINAGVLMDISFPFMLLADAPYKELRQALSRRLGSLLIPSPDDMFELCVAQADVSSLVPPLVLHFMEGGGPWAIPPENYWAPMDNHTSCMVVLNSAGNYAGAHMNRMAVIGNYMQQNTLVLYELHKVSFQPADCSAI